MFPVPSTGLPATLPVSLSAIPGTWTQKSRLLWKDAGLIGRNLSRMEVKNLVVRDPGGVMKWIPWIENPLPYILPPPTKINLKMEAENWGISKRNLLFQWFYGSFWGWYWYCLINMLQYLLPKNLVGEAVIGGGDDCGCCGCYCGMMRVT